MDGTLTIQRWLRQGLTPLRIVAVYALVGGLWILFSDQLLAALFSDPVTLARLGTLKGWCYVLVTAVLLYALIRRHEVAIRRANEALERRVKDRTLELETLLAVSHSVVSTLELELLLNLILERLQDVVDYTGASVIIREGEELASRAHRGPVPPEETSRMRFSTEQNLLREVILNQKSVVISDVSNGTPLACDLRAAVSKYVEARPGVPLGKPLDIIRSWMGVPLIVKGRAIGLLALSYSEPGHYRSQDTQLVKAFADQVAVTIENAQLYGQARQRLAAIESLQRVTTTLLQKLTLEETLEIVCHEACQLTGATGAAFFSLKDETWLEIVHSVGITESATTRIPLESTFTGQAILSGEPLLLNDPEELTQSSHPEPNLESLLVIPMRLRGSVVGALNAVNKPSGFMEEDVRILSLFADEAAIAIDSARLHEQAEKLAVMEERQRLARELHDSVTQALYSVTLYAEAARMAMSSGKLDVAAENLQELQDMAREAMLDMRMLIFELHPPLLEEEGLVAALQARLVAVETRAGLQTEIHGEGERRLPLSAEEELFWIALEAFNNVVKHARAQKVAVRLQFDEGNFCLEIQDDGRGFDPAKAEQSGGMGLRGMEERTQRINGQLEIQSAPGEGTTLRVTVGV
jgi:signal transduction histidine kinase